MNLFSSVDRGGLAAAALARRFSLPESGIAIEFRNDSRSPDIVNMSACDGQVNTAAKNTVAMVLIRERVEIAKSDLLSVRR